MKNYIELAHRTSAPVEPAVERLQNPTAAKALLDITTSMSYTGQKADDFKRTVFYGRDMNLKGGTLTPCNEAILKRLRNPDTVELIHAAIGLVTEADEFLQAIMAHVVYGEAIDTVLLKEELGDNQWYVAKAAKFTGTTMDEVQFANIKKLAARYGEKFSDLAAIERDLEGERAVLATVLNGAPGEKIEVPLRGNQLAHVPEPIKTAVFETVGEASMMWSETPKGVFESTKAKEIAERLCRTVVDYYEGQQNKPGMEAESPCHVPPSE